MLISKLKSVFKKKTNNSAGKKQKKKICNFVSFFVNLQAVSQFISGTDLHFCVI